MVQENSETNDQKGSETSTSEVRGMAAHEQDTSSFFSSDKPRLAAG